MNDFFDALRRLARVAWNHHGERVLQVGLLSYFGGYVLLVLLAIFVGQPPLTLGISFLPALTLFFFLVGRGYSGFVALFSTTEEGRRVFRALLTALAAQLFTGLALTLIPVHKSRFAAIIAIFAVLTLVLLHFGTPGAFAIWGRKWMRWVAVAAVAIVLLWAFLPRTMGLLDKKVVDNGAVDVALARALGDTPPASRTWAVEVGTEWTEVSIPENSKWQTAPDRKVELLLADGRKYIDGPGVRLRVGTIPGWNFLLRSMDGEVATVIVSTTPK